MRLNTTSETISFLRELETKSADFYQSMASTYSELETFFLNISKDNRKNISTIERTYFGVITDALEGCFAFDIDRSEYEIPDATATGNYNDDLTASLQFEDKIAKFYTDGAQQAKGLMADVPRVMERIGKARIERRKRLAELLENAGR